MSDSNLEEEMSADIPAETSPTSSAQESSELPRQSLFNPINGPERCRCPSSIPDQPIPNQKSVGITFFIGLARSSLIFGAAVSILIFVVRSLVYAIFHKVGSPHYGWIFLCSFFTVVILLVTRRAVMSLTANRSNEIPLVLPEYLQLSDEEKPKSVKKCRKIEKRDCKNLTEVKRRDQALKSGFVIPPNDQNQEEDQTYFLKHNPSETTLTLENCKSICNLGSRKKVYKFPKFDPNYYRYFIPHSATELTRKRIIQDFQQNNPVAYRNYLMAEAKKQEKYAKICRSLKSLESSQEKVAEQNYSGNLT